MTVQRDHYGVSPSRDFSCFSCFFSFFCFRFVSLPQPPTHHPQQKRATKANIITANTYHRVFSKCNSGSIAAGGRSSLRTRKDVWFILVWLLFRFRFTGNVEFILSNLFQLSVRNNSSRIVAGFMSRLCRFVILTFLANGFVVSSNGFRCAACNLTQGDGYGWSG